VQLRSSTFIIIINSGWIHDDVACIWKQGAKLEADS
jgi:hypothetical protein